MRSSISATGVLIFFRRSILVMLTYEVFFSSGIVVHHFVVLWNLLCYFLSYSHLLSVTSFRVSHDNIIGRTEELRALW
jgi:hypothetical protein